MSREPSTDHDPRGLPFPSLLGEAKWLRVQQEFRLTTRQVEIIGLITQGASNEEIGRRLGVGQPTVRGHCRSLYRKLGCNRLGTQKRLELALTLVHWSPPAKGSSP